MNLFLKNMIIVLSLITGSHAMEQINLFEAIPEDSQKIIILAEVAPPYYYKDGHPGELASVCKEWYKLINHSILMHPLYKSQVSMGEYCHFNLYKNGRLIYKPNPDYKNNMKIMRIADLMNSSGEFNSFNLNEWESIDQHIKITPGYKKQLPLNEKIKLQIWIVLRSEIEKDLKEGKAEHFREIFEKWNTKAPIGIFWTMSYKGINDQFKYRENSLMYNDLVNENNALKHYDYLITESLISISCGNLREKWRNASTNSLGAGYEYEWTQLIHTKECTIPFSLCFNPDFQALDNPPPIVPTDGPSCEFQVADEPFISYLGNPCVIS